MRGKITIGDDFVVTCYEAGTNHRNLEVHDIKAICKKKKNGGQKKEGDKIISDCQGKTAAQGN